MGAKKAFKRRTKTMWGLVNFPVDSVRYRDTGEGGMFVILVVEARGNYTFLEQFGPMIPMVEVYVGEDGRVPPVFSPTYDNPNRATDTYSEFLMHENENLIYTQRHFPNYDRDKDPLQHLFMAVPRERLDEVGQKVYDHKTAVLARFAAAIDSAKKELTINLPPPRSMPAREALEQ